MVGDQGGRGIPLLALNAAMGDPARLTADVRAAYDTAGRGTGPPDRSGCTPRWRPGAGRRGGCRWPSPQARSPVAGCSTSGRAPGSPAGPRSRPGAPGGGGRPCRSACSAAAAPACTRSPPTRPRCRSATAASTSSLPRSRLSHLPDLAAGLARGPAGRPGDRRQHVRARLDPPGQGSGRRGAPPVRLPRRLRGTLAQDAKPSPSAATLARLAGRGRGGRFSDVAVRTVTVPTGLSTPAELASWRLGMAHLAPFVRSLDPSRQAGLRRAAERAVAARAAGRWWSPMLVLTAR